MGDGKRGLECGVSELDEFKQWHIITKQSEPVWLSGKELGW